MAMMNTEATQYYSTRTTLLFVGNERPPTQHAADFLAKAKE